MSTAATAPAKDATDDRSKHPRDPVREVIETVVFVVVLVLLLKLFITEAFVIPTGSMAETLYGYQQIITCPKCGHEFPVNSHDEVEVNSQTKRKHKLVKYCCPNCRHEGKTDDLARPQDENPNRTGDRVLVLKPLYHVRPPRRGDVVVFKYPEDPQQLHTAQNYIKRAMGFGGETVAIHRGELYVTTSLTYPEDDPLFPRPADPLDLWKLPYMYANSGHAEALFKASRQAGFTAAVPGGFQIVRKGEDQVLADRRIVWDNDKQPQNMPPAAQRWVPTNPAAWKADDETRPMAFLHTGPDLDWIRYRHTTWTYSMPSPFPWKGPGADTATAAARVAAVADPFKRVLAEVLVLDQWARPEPMILSAPEISFSLLQGIFTAGSPIPGPVDNMLGYNAGTDYNPRSQEEQSRDNADGRPEQRWVGDLILECEAEVGAGAEVALELSKGSDRFRATFGGGKVTLSRSGGKEGEMGSKPCKVNAGTYKLRFANVDSRLMVWVDGKRIDFGPEADYNPTEPANYEPEDVNKEGWTRANDIDAPAGIGAKGSVPAVRHITLHRDVYYTRSRPSDHTGADIYYVHPGHYMCLGDNSAQSSDSRSWGTVPERLMLGKAVFVFWPAYPRPNRVGFIK